MEAETVNSTESGDSSSEHKGFFAGTIPGLELALIKSSFDSHCIFPAFFDFFFLLISCL